MLKRAIPICMLLVVNLFGPMVAEENAPTEKRIVWETSVLDAFVKAVESNKPLVVVFLSNPAFRNAQNGNSSNRLWEELDELVVHHLADDAVFAVTRFDHRTGKFADEYAGRMYAHLKPQMPIKLPSISVIEPRTDVLTESFRMEGLFPAEEVADDLSRRIGKHAASQVMEATPQAAGPPTTNFVPVIEVNPYEPSLK